MTKFPYFYPFYTKKTDVREIPKVHRKVIAIVLIMIPSVFGVMQLFVMPELFSIYSSLSTPIPYITQTSPYVFVAVAIIALSSAVYLLCTEPNYSKVDAVASMYQDGEMIKTRELIECKYEFIPLLFIALAIGYMV
ncbi:MAG: hypothetical protein ABIH84_00635, partial [bacterium]